MITESARSLDEDEEFVREVVAGAARIDAPGPAAGAGAGASPGAAAGAEERGAQPPAEPQSAAPGPGADEGGGDHGSRPARRYAPRALPADGGPLPEVPQQCIQFVIDASAKEERAMVFDRAGAYPGAVNLYREAAALLSQAHHLCPDDHPDCRVIEAHAEQVQTRAAYLYSLGVRAAEIPLEEHIQGAQLQMGPCAKKGTLVAAGALGGATGLVLLGPLGGAALAAGAAIATTRQDRVGSVARSIGEGGLQAVDSAKAFGQRYQIDRRLDETLHISETARDIDERLHVSERARHAAETVRGLDTKYSVTDSVLAAADRAQSLASSIDERYSISSKSQNAASKAVETIRDFNDRHHVAWRVNQGVSTASSTITSWASKALSGGARPGRPPSAAAPAPQG